MGTIKRLNDAQQRLQDAENAMPGAYDDQYCLLYTSPSPRDNV